MPAKQPFEDVAGFIQSEIAKRRHKWRMTNVIEWDDVAQHLLVRAYNKYHLYNPDKSPLQHWLNTLISNALKNLLRDTLLKSCRPCLGNGKDPHRCTYNAGGNLCSWSGNPTGIQCSACPAYKIWAEKKGNLYNISTPLSIENHSQEVNNLQSDFIDIGEKKKIIDSKIIALLCPREANLYTLLYIDHKTTEEVGKMLGYKKQKNSSTPGYQVILKFQKKVKKMARDIVENEDLM